jgi:glycosyltransferase involved in cell wall biosynthesis
MKVAIHVGQLLQPVPGGIGRYVEGLVNALPEAGVDVVPFAAGSLSPRRREAWPHAVNLGPPPSPWRYELWHRLRRPVVRLGTDVVHAPSLAIPPAGPAPLVVTVHDVAFLRHPEAFTRHGVEFHRRGLAITYREAAVVITASQFARGELIRAGFAPERIHLAPHGVAVPEPEPDNLAELRVRRVGVREPYVLCVGTIEPRKGLDVLASAFRTVHRKLPDASLVVVGPQGWLAVSGLDAAGIVELGRVDDATLDALYRRAEICAVPSRYEGFGLPALEAMARGTAVIASDASSLPEVVADAGLLVPPGDVAAWADALIDLLDDDATRTELGARGVRRAAGFAWAASAHAHYKAYATATERAVHS